MTAKTGTWSATNAATVTPADATVVEFRALYVGGAGNLVVTMAEGAVVTFSNVQAGTLLPIQVKAVMTATTATNIIGLT